MNSKQGNPSRHPIFVVSNSLSVSLCLKLSKLPETPVNACPGSPGSIQRGPTWRQGARWKERRIPCIEPMLGSRYWTRPLLSVTVFNSLTLWGTWVAIKLQSVIWYFLSKFLVKCGWGMSSTMIKWTCTTQSVFMETGSMLQANRKHTTWSGYRQNDRCEKRQKMVITESQCLREERSCYVLHYLCAL